MLMSVNDLHHCPVDGTDYWFRTPDLYAGPKLRWLLTRQKRRNPTAFEFQIAAFNGVEQIVATAGAVEEGARQKSLLEEWYRLETATNEAEIDVPDFELRAAELARREEARLNRRAEILPQVYAIIANLERHWSDYAELKADREYYEEIARIEVVRVLLARVGPVGTALPRDENEMLTKAAYQQIPLAHRYKLSQFGFALMTPTEIQRKN